MHKNSFGGLAPPGSVEELTAIHPTLWLDLRGEGPSGKREKRMGAKEKRKGREKRRGEHFFPTLSSVHISFKNSLRTVDLLSNFRTCLLWPNGWMDQDATWQGGRPRP